MPLNKRLQIKVLTVLVFVAFVCGYNVVRSSGKKIDVGKPPTPLSYISPGRTRFLLDDDTDNCSKPDEHKGFRDSCSFVRATCESEAGLVDYMQFVFCDLNHVKPLAYIIMGLWLLLIISLLATTVSNPTLLNKRLQLCSIYRNYFITRVGRLFLCPAALSSCGEITPFTKHCRDYFISYWKW